MIERMSDKEFAKVDQEVGEYAGWPFDELRAEAERARAAEERLEEEIEFLNKNYMDEDDKSLTLDAQLLKAKLIIKKLKAENAALRQI